MTTDATRKNIAKEFADRLDMLEESGQATALARRLTELSLVELSTELDLRLTEETSAQFVTHLAIALTRINRGESEIDVSVVVEEAITDRQRERAAVARTMRECSRLLQREISANEVNYMTVHLCSIVDLAAEVDS